MNEFMICIKCKKRGAYKNGRVCSVCILKEIEGEIKEVILDGKPSKKYKCPDCEEWGHIDDDQFNGKVSIQCDCGFHKTLNLSILYPIISD